MYKIEDLNDENVYGSFCSNELQQSWFYVPKKNASDYYKKVVINN